MNQHALINNSVKLQQQDPLQFRPAPRQVSTIPVEDRGRPCFSNLQGTFIVHLPADLSVEEWRCEGDFARVVALPISDPIYCVIDSMWLGATGGMHVNVLPKPVVHLQAQLSAVRAQAARRVERLTEIKANLGLSMQTLAEMLHVTRPTLYKWFDAEKLISLQKDSVRRVDKIEQLAQKWRATSVAPLGPWLRERIDGGSSMLDLLMVEPLPTVEIERAFMQIAARIVQAPKSRSARLREAGFTRRASHRSLPSDE